MIFFIDVQFLSNYLNEINRNEELTTFERRTFLTGKLIEKSRSERFSNDRYSISIDEYPFDGYPPLIYQPIVFFYRNIMFIRFHLILFI